jgi:pimeloyl-ACP methyl ester carboxylesterase
MCRRRSSPEFRGILAVAVILFAHGLESGPQGRKTAALQAAGLSVVAPDCRGRDLSERIAILRDAIASATDLALVVGSSFGGIAGLVAAIVCARAGVRVPPLLLCAPALQIPPPPPYDVELVCPAPTTIVHGVRDEVIPIAHSRDFSSRTGAILIEVDDDHALAATTDVIVDTARRLSASPPGC